MSTALGGWGEFAAAGAAFFLTHALPPRPALRKRAVALLGERGFTVVYSLLSLVVLAWLIAAAGRAPYVGIWPFAPWQLWVPTLVMPVAGLILVFGIATPNPLSFGGANNAAFDPDRPGILGVARHPVPVALGLWAGAHLVPNGDVAHVLLFGSFASFALFGMTMIDRRKRRLMGDAAWRRLAARTSFWPFAALATGRWRPRAGEFPLSRVIIAAVLLAALVLLHEPVIGVRPLPY
ncbi:MAG: NnrU family protein [Bauldia sp.]|nr:NnrU family protein [Bauldia sp.]